jgi:NAD(P)-dependent dehydrogenase (short-subunit alcohol dehydrogenase family)
MTQFELTGRTALVTGAGQNVGRGIAHALAGQGAAVIVNDVRQDRAEAVVGEIIDEGGMATAAPFDVTDLDSVMVALRQTGSIDILVNNAGNGGSEPMVPQPFVTMPPTDWEGPIRVNLYGVLHCCHAVVPGMCDRG